MSSSAPCSLSNYCSFDYVYNNVLCPFFSQLDDKRDFSQSYELADCIKAGFSIYSLKAASMYQFQQMSQAEDCNLSSVYKIGAIPKDNGLRKVLDGLSSQDLREGFTLLGRHLLSRSELYNRYQVWRDYLGIAIDGVEHFCSKKVSCPHCLTRKHRDGSQSNYHCMLSAAVIHADQKAVFPIDHEPIVRADGAVKNDCERSAVYRLLDHYQRTYDQQKTLFTMDALYACAPVVKRLEEVKNWRYIIGVKDSGHTHLFKQFDELNEQGKVKWIDHEESGPRKQTLEIGYVNSLELNAANKEVKVNLLYVNAKNAKGKQVVFSYITNIKLNQKEVIKLLRIGRSRWKIENETFNTLKNQGYQFKHNFGHGKNNLSTVMAYLMMMAFWVDQLQQAANVAFDKLLGGLKTRVKLWDAIRAVFKMIEVRSMKDIFLKVADMYCVRLI